MKINIIGAGVAGLSAGCYLQMNGFETTIFERHSTFGGLCTSWQRGGYTFESGLQWLLGSGKNNPFYLLWSELIDMNTINFVHHKVRMEIMLKDQKDVFGDNVFHLYTNLARLENYLLSVAPEDRKRIKQLIGMMRRIQSFEIPPMIRELPQLMPWHQKIQYIRYLPLLLYLNKIKKETNFTFAGKLKSPFLKEAFRLLFDGEEMPLLIITMPLAFNDLESAGYPIGGSVPFVARLEKRYLDLGGKVRYQAEVDKIMVQNNQAQGLLLKSGEKCLSEVTISAADWNFTVFNALEGKFVNPLVMKLKERKLLQVYYSVFMVSLGVDADLSDYPHFLRFPLKNTLKSPDGTHYERMELHINNYDPTLAPPGKTVVQISFYTKNASFWINLRTKDTQGYLAEKQNFTSSIIAMADTMIAGLKDKIEVVDIATPASFNRYTNNWLGSVQGWLPGKNIIAQSPVRNELPELKDFYFVGHWTIPGGGLPVAIKSARDVAQIICHRKKIPFRT